MAAVVVPPAPQPHLHAGPSSPTMQTPSGTTPSAANGTSAAPAPAKVKNDSQHTWEFTRRKRWPELLINELSEAIALILSPSGKILFCSPAVSELLGWRDEELIDVDLADLVNEDDRHAFRRNLADSVRGRTDMLAYARLRYKSPSAVHALQASLGVGALVAPSAVSGVSSGSGSSGSSNTPGDYGYAIPIAGPSTGVPVRPPPLPNASSANSASSDAKEVLFEIAAYPHFAPPADASHSAVPEECRCIFAVAKPYLSRNTAMLNTFLELKVENERLQQRLATLRAHQPTTSPSSTGSNGASSRPRVALRPPPLQMPNAMSGVAPTQASPRSAHPASGYGGGGGGNGAPVYGVPVSVPMPLSSLTGATFAPSQGGPPGTPTAYFTHQHHQQQQQHQHHQQQQHHGHHQNPYGDYGVGLGDVSGYRYDDARGVPATPAGMDLAARRASVSGPSVGDGVNGNGVNGNGGSGGGGGGGGGGGNGGGGGSGNGGEEESAKKKAKRRHVGEQFVCRTCGRTDSPEWRKGPQGPKTLCNACGLRWAKQVRKGGDDD